MENPHPVTCGERDIQQGGVLADGEGGGSGDKKRKDVRMEVFLTVDELSEKLRVSKVWLYKLVREKRIPFYRVEKCIRFSPLEIQDWLEQKRNKEWHRDK